MGPHLGDTLEFQLFGILCSKLSRHSKMPRIQAASGRRIP